MTTITHIGGPTALIEFAGWRLLTDPTFDAPGEYRLPYVRLRKIACPALAAEKVGPTPSCPVMTSTPTTWTMRGEPYSAWPHAWSRPKRAPSASALAYQAWRRGQESS